MQRKTIELIVKAFHAASDDQTRWFMASVGMEQKESGKISIFATNGHFLIENELVEPDFTEILPNKVYFSREKLPLLKLLLKDRKILGIDHRIEGKKLILEKEGIKIESDDFPQYPSLEPFKNIKRKKTVSITFNAEYLFKLSQAFDSNFNQVTIYFNPDDKKAPLSVEGNEPGMIGVLMPMKGN